jgi:hypothetical protein
MDRKYFGPYRKGEVLKNVYRETDNARLKRPTKTLTYKYRWSLLQNTVNENERGSSFRFYIIVFKRR